MDLAEQLRQDIRDFRKSSRRHAADHYVVRLDRIFPATDRRPSVAEGVREGHEGRTTRAIAPSMIYAYASLMEDVPFANGAPNLTVDIPGHARTFAAERGSDLRQGFQNRPDADEVHPRARLQGPPAGAQRLVLDQHSGQPRRRSARRSRVFQDQGRVQAGVLEHILQPELYPELYGNIYPQGPH